MIRVVELLPDQRRFEETGYVGLAKPRHVPWPTAGVARRVWAFGCQTLLATGWRHVLFKNSNKCFIEKRDGLICSTVRRVGADAAAHGLVAHLPGDKAIKSGNQRLEGTGATVQLGQGGAGRLQR